VQSQCDIRCIAHGSGVLITEDSLSEISSTDRTAGCTDSELEKLSPAETADRRIATTTPDVHAVMTPAARTRKQRIPRMTPVPLFWCVVMAVPTCLFLWVRHDE